MVKQRLCLSDGSLWNRWPCCFIFSIVCWTPWWNKNLFLLCGVIWWSYKATLLQYPTTPAPRVRFLKERIVEFLLRVEKLGWSSPDELAEGGMGEVTSQSTQGLSLAKQTQADFYCFQQTLVFLCQCWTEMFQQIESSAKSKQAPGQTPLCSFRLNADYKAFELIDDLS